MQINEVAYKWAGQLTRRTATRRIILHHAAAVTCTPQQVHQWLLANGWTGIGYHFFVRKDGTVYRGRPEDTVGAHAGNNNYDSLGVCFEGSFDRETMPDAQLRAGQELVAYLKQKYGISTVQRHSDVNATGCPGDNFPFDALAGAQAAKPAVPAPVISGTTLTLPLLTTASRGDTVRCVQAALTGLGYDAGGADGIYGTNTAAAVKRFQASRGIAADGLVGRDTWHKLLGGKVEALEFTASNDGNGILHTPLMKLPLRHGVLLAAIVREGRTIIPGGMTTIEPGDHVLVVTNVPGLTDLKNILA